MLMWAESPRFGRVVGNSYGGCRPAKLLYGLRVIRSGLVNGTRLLAGNRRAAPDHGN
jgi:hypothetical protein